MNCCPVCGTSYDIYLRVLCSGFGIAGCYHPTCINCEIVDQLPAFRKERYGNLRSSFDSLPALVENFAIPTSELRGAATKVYEDLERMGLVKRVEADS